MAKTQIVIKQSITDRGDKSFNLFLKDVARYPLLSAERECNLFEEFRSEGTSIKRKEEIKREIICANLRFVVSIAKQYVRKDLPLLDLVQQACIGLCVAVDKFDYTKGFKFISYAVWWIRSYITHFIITCANGTTRAVRALHKYNTASNKNYVEFGDYLQLDDFLEAEGEQLAYSDILSAKSFQHLSDYLTSDEDGTLEDVIGTEELSPEVNSVSLECDVRKALDEFSVNHVKEADLLRKVYGIGYAFPQHKSYLALEYGKSQECIRQMCIKAQTLFGLFIKSRCDFRESILGY